MCHSAGTEACLNAITIMKNQGADMSKVDFIFDSPRMEFGQFDAVIRAAQLDRNQVTVIGARKDLWHWADPSLLDPNIKLSELIKKYFDHASYDYTYNPEPSYRWMFLELDQTAIDQNIDPILGHGAMFEGELAGHRYNIRIDGTIVEDQNIAEAYQSRNDT